MTSPRQHTRRPCKASDRLQSLASRLLLQAFNRVTFNTVMTENSPAPGAPFGWR
jgi:hypothetical protein